MRTFFGYLSGMVVFLIAWAIAGQVTGLVASGLIGSMDRVAAIAIGGVVGVAAFFVMMFGAKMLAKRFVN